MPTTMRSIVLLLALSGLPANAYAQGPPLSEPAGWSFRSTNIARCGCEAFPPDPPADAAAGRRDDDARGIRTARGRRVGDRRSAADRGRAEGRLGAASRFRRGSSFARHAWTGARFRSSTHRRRMCCCRSQAVPCSRSTSWCRCAPTAGTETMTIPASKGAVSRLGCDRAASGLDVAVTGGVLAERAETARRPLGRIRPPGSAAHGHLEAAHRGRAVDAGAEMARQRHAAGRRSERRPARSPPPCVSKFFRASPRRLTSRIPDGVIVNQVSGAARRRLGRPPGALQGQFPRAGPAADRHSRWPARARSRATDRSPSRWSACRRQNARAAASRWRCSAPAKSPSGSRAGWIRRIPPISANP